MRTNELWNWWDDMEKDLQRLEREYITGPLLDEFRRLFLKWNAEYGNVERDLGMRASFAEVWRKTKKVKAIVWDGVDDTTWREDLRTILFEIIGHAFLMLFDLDKEDPKESAPDPLRCPTCDSPAPGMMPAVGGGGEIARICTDRYHDTGA